MHAPPPRKSETIIEALQATPEGLTAREISGVLKMGEKVTSYHLGNLRRDRRIRYDADSHRWTIAAPKAPSREAAPAPDDEQPTLELFPKTRPQGVAVSAPVQQAMQKVLAIIRDAGGAPVPRIAIIDALEKDGVERRIVPAALTNLEKRGLARANGLPRVKGGGWILGDGTPAPRFQSAYERRRAREGQNVPAVLETPVAAQARSRAVPQRMNGRGSSYVERQVQSIILRMENANEGGQLFTEIDFTVMHKLAEAVHK